MTFAIAIFGILTAFASDSYSVFAGKLNPFGEVKTPTGGNSVLIGGYSAGCLGGAARLPKSGKGFEAMRLQRRRYYGHPSLIALIERAGRELSSHSPLYIGDMSLPRGGPMPTGHGSHQIGLDVDIWYFTTSVKLTDPLREKLAPLSVLQKDFIHIDESRWLPLYEEQLLWFAGQPEVERIFVNGAIKKRLCSTHALDPRMQKLRPWFEHEDHFHVRIKCPQGQSACVSQSPPDGIECDEEHLKDWFSDQAVDKLRHPKPLPPHPVELPLPCRALVEAR